MEESLLLLHFSPKLDLIMFHVLHSGSLLLPYDRLYVQLQEIGLLSNLISLYRVPIARLAAAQVAV